MNWRLPMAFVMTVAVQPTPAPARVPIVVELFTSEGCSSCPPADALLSRLAKEQPVPGAEIVPLGMHVTYWDQLGWKDPASLNSATERQQSYSRIFGADRMYTPQAVIDGADDVIGSDEAGIRKAVAHAVSRPHARVSLQASVEGSEVMARVSVAELPAPIKEALDARVVLSEDGLESIVTRGENGGRTLHNDAVVRAMAGGGAPRTTQDYRIPLRPQWHRDRLRLTVLLQGRTTQRIYGAATTALPELRH